LKPPSRTFRQKRKASFKKKTRHLILLALYILPVSLFCQAISDKEKKDTPYDMNAIMFHGGKIPLSKQRDLIDLFLLWLLKKNPDFRLDSNKKQTGRLHISGAPSPSYTLATSLAINITANIAFYAGDRSETNISSIIIAPLYSIKKQFALPGQFSIWTKDNKYNIVGDWRFLSYPEHTYGLGGLTIENDTTSLNYDYVRMYTFLLKTIAKDFYAGIGYQYDNHWNIQQLNVPPNTITDFDKYGFTSSSISSGVSANILFDDRRNSINPEAGSTYANIVFRQNLRALGSDENRESLLIDVRKYFRFNDHTSNVLGIWSITG
jgi:hypothetical protein